jgi:hypothetical protein
MLRKVLIGVNTSVPRRYGALTVGVTVEAQLRRLNDDLEGVAFAGIVRLPKVATGRGTLHILGTSVVGPVVFRPAGQVSLWSDYDRRRA